MQVGSVPHMLGPITRHCWQRPSQHASSAVGMRPVMSAKSGLHRTRMLLTAVAVGCGIAVAGTAVGQPYPNRTIRLVVPYVAGGPTDIVARAIADKLSIGLRQPIVIENRPGAGGNLGTEAIAKA